MKKYDIILYGATGFTGKRSVEYFQKHAAKTVKWAIAGRNKQKLLALKEALKLSVDVLVADALNRDEIDFLVKQTKIILTTAGPYALYGSNIIASCAHNGVHYVDITGESPGFVICWINTEKQQKNLVLKSLTFVVLIVFQQTLAYGFYKNI